MIVKAENERLKGRIEKDTVNYNKSTYFVLPLVGLPTSVFGNEYVNSYMDDGISIQDIDDNSVFVLLKYSDAFGRKEIMNRMSINMYYEGSMQLDNPEYTMLRFSIPKEFNNDIQLFYDGKYSRMSKDAKDRILQNNINGGFIANVINRAESLRKKWESAFDVSLTDDAELWDKPDQFERFDISDLERK